MVSCIQQCFTRFAALNDRQVLPPQKICCDRNADGVLVIDGQAFLLESAVNNDIVIILAQRRKHLRQHLLRAAPGIVYRTVLRELHNLKPRRRVC